RARNPLAARATRAAVDIARAADAGVAGPARPPAWAAFFPWRAHAKPIGKNHSDRPSAGPSIPRYPGRGLYRGGLSSSGVLGPKRVWCGSVGGRLGLCLQGGPGAAAAPAGAWMLEPGLVAAIAVIPVGSPPSTALMPDTGYRERPRSNYARWGAGTVG